MNNRYSSGILGIWIENMNTVLDDNMTLCLSNGERIKLIPEMKMIFECEDLSQASPATVSRCGMVFSSGENCKWPLLVKSWIKQLDPIFFPPKVIEILQDNFDSFVPNIFDMIKISELKEPIKTMQNQ